MFTKLIAVGRVAHDPERRQTAKGDIACGTAIAISEKRNGKEETYFLPISLFGRNAENFLKFVRKGRLILASGKLSQFTTKDGRTMYECFCDDFRMLDPKNQTYGTEYAPGTPTSYETSPNKGAFETSPYERQAVANGSKGETAYSDPLLEDDLPF